MDIIVPPSILSVMHMTLQIRTAMTRFSCILNATRCTKTRELTGSLQSTDVCLTTPVWLSSTTTWPSTFPALYWWGDNRRGLDWWSQGGRGLLQVSLYL